MTIYLSLYWFGPGQRRDLIASYGTKIYEVQSTIGHSTHIELTRENELKIKKNYTILN